MIRHVICGLAAAWLAAFPVMSAADGTAGATGVLHYPAAPRGTVVDTMHGTEVADPYRWMEAPSPELSAWVAAETLSAGEGFQGCGCIIASFHVERRSPTGSAPEWLPARP